MELQFHQLDVRYEYLRLWRPERERRLLASLAENGQQVPIVVVALGEDAGRYRVIDGHKRVRLLRRPGADTVQATVWELSEAEALLLDPSLRTADAETAIEQGWLLQELRNLPLSRADLAQRFDRSVGLRVEVYTASCRSDGRDPTSEQYRPAPRDELAW